jgi:uncharacterized RmlC-like cupin family protein
MSEQAKRLVPGSDGSDFDDATLGDNQSVRVARRGRLAGDTAQSSGLLRRVAFDSRNPDAHVLSAFLSTVLPGAATGAHHHGDQETILYVVEGIARFRWGERLEHVVDAGPGDFVFIPAHTVHQEINASADRPTVWVVTRSGTDPIVVNVPELDEFAESPARDYPTTEPATPWHPSADERDRHAPPHGHRRRQF